MALGLPIMCVDEWRTSLTCCQCKVEGVLDGRAIKCKQCDQERDRDHNGAHNIARATHHWIEHQAWPEELTRPQLQVQ